MKPFALLDDRHATREAPTSRLYEGHVRTHRCVDPASLDAVWSAIDADLQAGLHAVVVADYEWGAKLLRAGHAGLAADDASALRVLMFERVTHLSQADASAWLADLEASEQPAPAGTLALDSSVDRAAFVDAIERIHEAIRAGETYQVNYTYRLSGQAFGSPVALYRRMRERQPVAYGAFIALPNDEPGGITHVLSCSPELFLRHDDGLLTARPMKGTAPRIAAPESDSETARLLSLDVKNRAENLMIVDLLRNDLGRLAEVGSVAVPSLFAIEPYSTVFQMTSTVQARLRREVGFPELLRAVFPCGSITGAPKHHTMELIAGLETTPRGLYCGAIGWLDAPQADARIGNFCLSVAIRTATLKAPDESTGLRPIRLGIGAGIVIDSRAADEWDECRLKGRFLSALDPGFELFETMLWQPATGYARLDRHLARLQASAVALGFACDAPAIEAALATRARRWADSDTPKRVRLALSKAGLWTIVDAPLAPLRPGPVGLLVADATLPAIDPLRAHKTTARRRYDAGVRRAEAAGAFDSLYFSDAGHLVEGGRSSAFLRLDGHWWTPPLTDGVLPGVMRSELLDDPAWDAAERSLTRSDLWRADAIVVCNALRGALQARLVAMPAVLPAESYFQ